MKILFYPEPDGANEYTANMVNNIQAVAGETVAFSPNIKDLVLKPHKTWRFHAYDVAVVNWLENNLRSDNKRLFVWGVLKFFIYIAFFKLVAKKTVYIRHNVYPHDLAEKQTGFAKKIIDFGERFFDKKVTHSGHLLNEGYDYIPHPLYQVELTGLENLDTTNSYYLIFGRVARYKQIETIIQHWPEDETLLIAGPCADKDYLTSLQQLATGKNIQFDIRFIPNEIVDDLMNQAKAVILSHGGDEMIVSGSFFHAISYGVPVIASPQTFLNWLQHDVLFSGLTLYRDMAMFEAQLKQPLSVTKSQILSEAEVLFGQHVVQTSLKRLFTELQPGYSVAGAK